MSLKIVVTGANGQLGSEIRAIAPIYPHSFIYTDIDSLDLTDRRAADQFLDRHTPDVIINCAAYTAVDRAEEDRDSARSINAGIPGILAVYADKTGCRIIHISTDYVFGGNDDCKPRLTIDDARPISVYGETKREGEEKLSGCKTAMVIRTSWLYSTYGNNFVKTMTRLMQERDEISVVYDQVGSPTYAADLANAILTIIGRPDDFIPGIYHYTNEGIASWYDFAYEIRIMTGSKCKLFPVETKDFPLPAKRPHYAVLSKEKIKKRYELDIPHWKDGLKRYYEKLNG